MTLEQFIEQYDAKLTKAKMDKLFKEFLSQYDVQFGEEKKLSKEQEDEAFRKFLAEYDNKVQQRILHEKELEVERMMKCEELIKNKTQKYKSFTPATYEIKTDDGPYAVRDGLPPSASAIEK